MGTEAKNNGPHGLSEDERFAAFLKKAHEEVRMWPEWKQNLLGWHYRKRRALEKGRA